MVLPPHIQATTTPAACMQSRALQLQEMTTLPMNSQEPTFDREYKNMQPQTGAHQQPLTRKRTDVQEESTDPETLIT